MTATMERDFLGYASGFQPILQGCLRHLVCESLEHYACSAAANQFQSLVTDGIVHKFLGLLHTKGDIHTTITVWLYVLPCKLTNIALSQSCQTGKEEGGLQYRIFTRSVRQSDKFILGQMFLFCWDSIYALQETIRILHDLVFPVSGMEHGTVG